MKAIFKITNPLFLSVLALGFLAVSCNDLLEQKPPDTGSNILPEDAIQNATHLNQVLISAYDVMANTYDGRSQIMATLLSDNLSRPVNQDNFTSVWLRSTTIFNGSVGDVFAQFNRAILRANTVIENMDRVELTASERQRIEAEARFIRALCHFDCMRRWAYASGYTLDDSHFGIAIRASSDIVNAPRASVGEVYEFILADIEFAKQNLLDFNDVYANKTAAFALEAEVRFQRHEYTQALALANQAINDETYMFDSLVNRYQFPQASPEAIFYIFSAIRGDGVTDNRNGFFRNNYFANGNPPLRIRQEFYDQLNAVLPGSPRASLYQELDQDGNISYITTMFNAESFNIPVLSMTQMMLIRAESLAETGGDLTQAVNDINAIRQRAYGGVVGNLLPSASAADIIDAARAERRMEFPFSGQRYFDLVRMGSQGENIIVRDAPWDCGGMILQFPSTERTDLFPLNQSGGC